ncbi:MAG TPA: alpha/beta hydrolase, partial [Armatimonadota bacterium]
MTVTLETTQLAHEDHGTGVPVVLLHAFPLDRRLWAPQVPELSRACWLILPDCPGFGGTPPLPDGASLDDYAGLVVGLLDRLGLETAVVGGLSMGGYVTCALARLHPERLRAVILADTKAGEDSPQV